MLAKYQQLILLLAAVVLAATSGVTTAAQKVINIDYPYVINLMSTKREIQEEGIDNLEIFQNYRLYTTTANVEGKSWSRLRLGFFKTKKQAMDAYKKVVDSYPGAWVTIALEEERINSINTAILLYGPVKRNVVSDSDDEYEVPSVDASSGVGPPKRAVAIVAKPALAPDMDSSPTPDLVAPSDSSEVARSEEPTLTIPTSPLEEQEEITPIYELPTVSTDANDAPSKTSEDLLLMARKAITGGDYSQGIQLSNAILEMPPSPESQDALELLGLARERNGQKAHAKAEYEKYLSLYPEGEDTDRVNQRLAGLVTATSKPTVTTNTQKEKKTPRPSTKWRTVGSLSQFYYHDERSVDEESYRVELSNLVTTFDLSVRGRSDRFDHRVQITGDNGHDFIDNENDGRFSRLFYEVTDKKRNNRLKLGRQDYSKGGVLGRFDGAVLGLGITKKTSVNVATGYLLDIDNYLDFSYVKNRRFLSLNVDLGNQLKDWNISFYGVQQMVDDVVDRQAVGGEVRYFRPTFNVFSILDYDTSYQELNIFLLNANWIKPQQGTLYTTIDIRKVPYLSTSNALQGQPSLTIEELLKLFSEEEVRQLAQDRTATSQTFTFGGSKQLNRFLQGHGQYQVSGDFTINNTSGMPESGGIPEIPASGNNYFFGGQMIGNSILKSGDTSILSLRFGFTEAARDMSINFDTRYPLTSRLRFNPRLRYLHRTGLVNDSKLNTVRLSAKADYQFRSVQFEGELGVDFTSDELSGDVIRSRGLFSYVGYRWDF